jgi:hypothetical protein
MNREAGSRQDVKLRADPTNMTDVRERGSRRESSFRALASVLAGAIVTVITGSILVGLGYRIGVIAISGAPASELARRALLWTGPALILAAASGGYLASRLAGRRTVASLSVGALNACAAILLVVAMLNIFMAASFDFRSASIALGFTERARTAEAPMTVGGFRSGSVESESVDRARRRTVRAVGWMASFTTLVVIAGAVGGWLGAVQQRYPGTIGSRNHG